MRFSTLVTLASVTVLASCYGVQQPQYPPASQPGYGAQQPQYPSAPQPRYGGQQPQWPQYPTTPYIPNYPEYCPPEHIVGNPWGGFPSYPSWNQPGQWNPYGNHHHHHHGHGHGHGHGHHNYGFNFADKYAMDYFQRNGFSVQSALHFCNGYRHKHIIHHSRYLRSYCQKIRQNYGADAIPTYPKVPGQAGSEFELESSSSYVPSQEPTESNDEYSA
uniref:Secreted protein n=1 Tax=Rhabditophanes sp. KR3021 TaxID=114890 RepID=A0AC35TZ13_9BILA